MDIKMANLCFYRSGRQLEKHGTDGENQFNDH